MKREWRKEGRRGGSEQQPAEAAHLCMHSYITSAAALRITPSCLPRFLYHLMLLLPRFPRLPLSRYPSNVLPALPPSLPNAISPASFLPLPRCLSYSRSYPPSFVPLIYQAQEIMRKGEVLIKSGIQKFSDDLEKVELLRVGREGRREGGKTHVFRRQRNEWLDKVKITTCL